METLCPACRCINVETLAQPSWYQHLSLGALLRSSERCRVCSLFVLGLREAQSSSIITTSDSSKIWQDTWSLSMHLSSGVRPHIDIRAQDDQALDFVQSYLAVRTDENDPSTKNGVRPITSLPRNTQCTTSFATARNWIADCIAGHDQKENLWDREEGTKSLDNNDGRPQRLVFVTRCGTELSLELVIPSSSAHEYTALSHCVRRSATLDKTG